MYRAIWSGFTVVRKVSVVEVSSIRWAGIVGFRGALLLFLIDVPNLRMHERLDPAHRIPCRQSRLEAAIINPTLAFHPEGKTVQQEKQDRQSDQDNEDPSAKGKVHGDHYSAANEYRRGKCRCASGQMST